MEDKKLNFNRPLLSVRRFPSKFATQKDSRRKNESSHPAILSSPSYKSESQSGPLRNPGTVPFVWEHSPGEPKDETKTQKHIKERSHIVPNLPPGRTLKPGKQNLDTIAHDPNTKNIPRKESLGSCDVIQTQEKLTKFYTSKETKKERPRSKDDDDDGNGHIDMHLDARTYGPNFLELNDHDSEEDSDLNYDNRINTSYKVCGLLPHFCLTGSIGLLNPLPGFSVRTRSPISSTNTTHSGSSSATSQAAYDHKTLVKDQNDQIVSKNDSIEGSIIYDRFQGYGVSNKVTESSPIPAYEQKEVNLQKGGLISFKELLAYENEKESASQNSTVEKTLYIDTIHKKETSESNEQSNVKGNRTFFEVLHTDLLADESKQIKEMKTETGFFKDQKVDQDRKVLELPAPPPLPKSPSDSWLWRTLPSVSSKAALRRNPKYPTKLDKNIPLRNPQGLLVPIPET